MPPFKNLINTLQKSIFSWDYFCDFDKIQDHSFKIKVQLNILNSLLGEKDIENKFIELVKNYPEVRKVLPILIATRQEKIKDFPILTDRKNLIAQYQSDLFNSKSELDIERILIFFRESGLKEIFENKYISNLEDYVFGIEAGLDTNARKNRTGTLMENLVEDFIKDFCEKNPNFRYKEQATSKYISDNWGLEIKSDKANRRYDFAIFNTITKNIYLIEVNYYGGGGSKLKAVAGEFTELYANLEKQSIPLIWITDGLGWNSSKSFLEEAYNKTNGSIYNLEMLKNGILDELIK